MAFSENPLLAMDQDPLRITVKDECISNKRKPCFTHPCEEQTIRVKQEETETTQSVKVEEDPLALPDMKPEAEESNNFKLELSEHHSTINQPCHEEDRPTFVAFSKLRQHLLAFKTGVKTSKPTENEGTTLQVPEAGDVGKELDSNLSRPCIVPPSLCNNAADQRNIENLKDIDRSTNIILRGLLGLPSTRTPTIQNKTYKLRSADRTDIARCAINDLDHIDQHVKDITRDTEITPRVLVDLPSTSTHRHTTRNKTYKPRRTDETVAARCVSNDSDPIKVHWEQEEDGTCICKICNRKLYRDNILEHIRSHLNIRLFSCTMCDSKFITSSSLWSHRKWHAMKYKCKMCSRQFALKSQLKDHANFHKGLRPYKCKLCKATFAGKGGLITHADKLHRPLREPYICEECGRMFKEITKLRLHVKIVHRGTHRRCSRCRTIILSTLFESHTALHRQENRPYICDICAKSFTSRRAILSHIEKVHAVGKYKCKVCGKRYKAPQAINDHMLSHQGIRKYCCPICGKTFASQVNFDTHKFVHREKNFVCHVCDAKFNRNDNLKSHVKRMHENKKPVQKKPVKPRSIAKKRLIKLFNCSTCEKSFDKNKLLKEHLLTHDERYSVCDFCSKPYLSKAKLSHHIIKVHLNNCK